MGHRGFKLYSVFNSDTIMFSGVARGGRKGRNASGSNQKGTEKRKKYE